MLPLPINLCKWSSSIPRQTTVWVAVTTISIAFIAVWLVQTKENLNTAAARKPIPATSSADAEQIEKPVRPQSMTITSDSDSLRAGKYEQEKFLTDIISPMLETVQQHISNNQLTLPKHDNAWDTWQHILEIQPNNSKARSGLVKVRNLLIINAQTAIDAGDFAQAENWLAQLDMIQPDDPVQAELRTEIDARTE